MLHRIGGLAASGTPAGRLRRIAKWAGGVCLGGRGGRFGAGGVGVAARTGADQAHPVGCESGQGGGEPAQSGC